MVQLLDLSLLDIPMPTNKPRVIHNKSQFTQSKSNPSNLLSRKNLTLFFANVFLQHKQNNGKHKDSFLLFSFYIFAALFDTSLKPRDACVHPPTLRSTRRSGLASFNFNTRSYIPFESAVHPFKSSSSYGAMTRLSSTFPKAKLICVHRNGSMSSGVKRLMLSYRFAAQLAK